MGDNCLLGLESSSSSSTSSAAAAAWAYNSSSLSFPETLWSSKSEAYLSREKEALTKALQISMSATASISSASPSPSPSPSQSQSQSELSRNHRLGCSGGKISKRKSRASNKSPTTYITADPANFRQMVQQVTGVRFGDAALLDSIIRPEPQRGGFGAAATATAATARGSHLGLLQQHSSCLPTLDTSSAFLLDGTRSVAGGSVGPLAGPVSGFELDQASFSNFPTLESWAPI